MSRAKRDDPLSPVTVLAPDQVAGTLGRRHLALHGLEGGTGPGIAGIDVTTLARLAERLAAPRLAPRRPATRQVLASAWRRVLHTDPGVFVETHDHPATVRALVTAHRELRDLSPAELETVAEAGPVSADLVRLHGRVTDLLAADWYDETDLLRTASGLADRVAATVVLYLPQDLTSAEATFVDALGAARGVTVITGHTHVERADRAIRDRWPDSPRPDPRPVATATEVLHASDSDDEVRCVVRQVVSALQDTPAHRVAVLYTAADPYAALLHEHLGAAGIRVNGPGSRPVLDRALARAVLGLLELTDDDLSRTGLFRALSGAPLRDFHGRRIPVATWERASREAGVVRGTDWQVRLDALIVRHEAALTAARDDENEGRARHLERQVTAARELRAFATRLRAELDHAAGLTTWADLADWARRLVTTLVGEPRDLADNLPLEEQHAATQLLQQLSGLEVLDTIDPRASLSALRDALEVGLADSVPRVGRFGDGVLVAPLSQSVGLDADVVHVVGLSEDLYPGRPGGDSLLPDALRDAIPALRSVRQRHGTAYRHLLAAFAAAPRVVASFPRGDLRSASRRLPSRWLLGTFRELAGDKGLALSDWDSRGDLGGRLVASPSFSAQLLRTPHLATEREWRTRAAAADLLRDDVVAAAREMDRARAGTEFTRFDGNLTGVAGLPDYRDGRRVLSPTALEAYVDCPHGFFVSRLLRVQPLEQPEDIVRISPMEIGNLVHRSLEQLVTEEQDALPGYGEPWTQQQRTRLVEIVREQAVELERTGLTGHPRLWQHERDRIEVDLGTMLTTDDAWRREHDARVAASEMAFGTDGHEPVVLDVPGGQVRLRGSADMVHLGRDGTVYVTDVKTGSDRTYRQIRAEDPLAGGTRFQLPVYGLAARARFGTPDARVRADYWFVRKDKGRIGIEVDDEVLAELGDTLGRLTGFVSDGLFPPRPPDQPDFSWVQCQFCNPDGVGHGSARERWERQRHDPALADFLTLVEPDVAEEGA